MQSTCPTGCRMHPKTAELWEKQDKHTGDRWRLFSAIADIIDVETVFYPGCYVDVAPSFVFPSVTYLDNDKRAPRFFADLEGVREIVAQHDGPADPHIRFIHGDYRERLDLPDAAAAAGAAAAGGGGRATRASTAARAQLAMQPAGAGFDLLISLYAGFISECCARYLKVGGTLLVNPSHGDAAMASLDPRYALAGVVHQITPEAEARTSACTYRVDTTDLESYMIPKNPRTITVESLRRSNRGVVYTKSPFAYLFSRVA